MNEPDMLAALRAGATLVTVNNRLARHWRKRFADAAQQAASVWPAPDILPWGAWLRRQWEEASLLADDAPLLLDARQTGRVWQDIIDDGGLPLLQAAGSAKLAQEAWTLVQDWRLALPFEPLESHDDVRHFERWAARFNDICTRQGWLDEARLPARLIEALADGRLAAPSHLLLLGFEDWTPLQRAVLEALRLRGSRIDEWTEPAHATPSRAVRHAFSDMATEDEAAVRWARDRLDRDPGLRLAIIAPDLRDRRARLTRLLDAQLAPHTLLPGQGDEARPWNISLGLPLGEHGMVRAAFLIFALGDARLETETLSQALRSPFLAGFAQERDARALLDASLRKRGERRVSRDDARRQAAEGGCPTMGRLLARLHEARQSQPSRQSPADWVRSLRDELKLAGWPGDAALGSHAFQLRQTWLDAMMSLARLAVVQPRMTRAEALAQLRALAAETLFQPEAISDAPVQVLGPLEAIGLSFDAVWLLGMHHEQWPPDARPNPFLPMRLQARLGLPHASPARELAYLRRVSGRLLELAPEVIVSHPVQDAGRDLEPSPLFDHLPWLESALPQSALPMPAQWASREVELEWLDDTQAPPLEEGALAPGGARVLELQSACPFRAFAELRLQARPLEEPDLGPDARVRGNLLHGLMERLWGELGDQAGLEAMCNAKLAKPAPTGGELADMVQGHARAVVDEEARHRRDLWPERLKALETVRLTALALEWLDVERSRPAFTVEAREAQQTVEIGGLRLHVKLDRVDALESGGRMILDYKTGQASPSEWDGERPAAPQLPLYAVTTDDVRAIAFARLRAGEVGLLARGEGLEPARGDERDWPRVMVDWRRVLEGLAADFRAGRAAVDPRKPGVCTHCPLGMLCRIHEQAGMAFALGESGREEA